MDLVTYPAPDMQRIWNSLFPPKSSHGAEASHSPQAAASISAAVAPKPEQAGGEWQEGSSKPVDCIVLSNGRHTANPYLGAATGEHDLDGGMDCPFRVNDATPIFTLHFVGQPNNTLGDIEVLRGGKIIQTITGHEVDLDALGPAGLDSEVKAIDANFDGYQDLELLNDCGATGNCSSVFYLYDPAEGKFDFDKFLSGLTSPEFDVTKKQINATWNSSAIDWGSSTYEFRNGEYVEIERFVSDDSGEKTYQLKDGKMVLVKSE